MLEVIITSSALIVILILLRYLFKGKINPRLQYALWLLVAVRLLLPFPLFNSPFSILSFVDMTEQNFHLTGNIVPVVKPSLTPGMGVDLVEGLSPVVDDYPVFPGQNNVANQAVVLGKESPLNGPVYYFWLAGAAMTGLWFIWQNSWFYTRLRKTRKRVKVADSELPVYVSPSIKSPCLFGLKPAIYIHPDSLLDEESLKYILAHEETHYHHGDHLWSWLRCLCLALHWFNPLVWRAAVLSRRDCEIACDESTLNKIGDIHRKAYGNILINMIEHKAGPGDLLLGATTMTSGKSGIKERITMIAQKPKMAIYTFMAVLLIAVIAVGCTFTGAKTNVVDEWTPQPEIENQDQYFEALGAANKSIKTEEISVENLGSNEEIARAWMDEYFAMFKALPKDNMAYITEGVIDRLGIKAISKEGLPKAFVFDVTFSVRPTYPIASNSFWMAGNTGNSPGRDETWGQMYREVELRLAEDGRYHYADMGTGGVGFGYGLEYFTLLETPELVDEVIYPAPPEGEWGDTYTGFTSEKEGWFVGSPGVAAGMSKNYVFLTHDSGETWVETGNVNEEWPRVLTAAAFADEKTGYLCFRYDIENLGRVYQTIDGGVNWRRMEIPLLPLLVGDGVGEVRTLGFDGNGNGKMVFYFRNEANQDIEGEERVFVTSDKGQTWVSVEEFYPGNGDNEGNRDNHQAQGPGPVEASLYERGGITIAVPNKYLDQLLIDPIKYTDPDTLIMLHQKSTYEKYEGMGFLFGVIRIDTAQYEQYLGADGSGYDTFAKDDSSYYLIFQTTDVQAPDDYEAYSELKKALVDYFKKDIINRNKLIPYSDDEFFKKKYTYESEHLLLNYYPYYAYGGSKDIVWKLTLSQPAKQGEEGIWCVERWQDENGYVYPYFPDEDGKPSAEIYAKRQEKADSGADKFWLDPKQSAVNFVKEAFQHDLATKDSFSIAGE